MRYLNFNLSNFLLFIICSILLPQVNSFSFADENDLHEQQALALQSKYSSLISLTFDFDQITRTGTRQRVGSGDAVFYRYQKPVEGNGQPATQSVMRWNYSEPDTQFIISDGETLSIYTEKDRQLIQTPARGLESDITYAFFAGSRKLLDDFAVRPGETGNRFSNGEKLSSIILVPREPHNQIRDVQVWFDANQLIRHLLIRDHFDSVTELNFSNLKADNLAPGDRDELEKITTFPIPPGTEIISR